jgi:hypothetical protein
MFGKRSKDAARRQRALEELLWLDPVDRERRIIAAVANGDFSADEAEAALRLVARLDSLRTMSLPPGGRLIGGRVGLVVPPNEPKPGIGIAAARASLNGREEDPNAGALPGASGSRPILAVSQAQGDGPGTGEDVGETPEPVAIPIVPDPTAVPVDPDLVGIPIVPDNERERTGDAVGGMLVPLDALESAERWLAAERAAGPPRAAARRSKKAPGPKALGPRVDWPADELGETGEPGRRPGPAAGAVQPTWIHPA